MMVRYVKFHMKKRKNNIFIVSQTKRSYNVKERIINGLTVEMVNFCRRSLYYLFFVRLIGGFVQIRTNQFDQVGERSQFDSPILDALSEEGCVQFHYNIAGSDNDWLNVYVEDYWSGSQSCVWHMNGSNVPDRWVASEAPLKVEKEGKYQVGFVCR